MSRDSTTGAVVWLNDVLVSVICRTQTVIALKSPEAECYACTVGTAEGKYAQALLGDRGLDAPTGPW